MNEIAPELDIPSTGSNVEYVRPPGNDGPHAAPPGAAESPMRTMAVGGAHTGEIEARNIIAVSTEPNPNLVLKSCNKNTFMVQVLLLAELRIRSFALILLPPVRKSEALPREISLLLKMSSSLSVQTQLPSQYRARFKLLCGIQTLSATESQSCLEVWIGATLQRFI